MKSNIYNSHSILRIGILTALGLFQAHSGVSADVLTVAPPFVEQGNGYSVGIRDDGVMVVFGGAGSSTFIPKALPKNAEPVNYPDNVFLIAVDDVFISDDYHRVPRIPLKMKDDGGVSIAKISWNIPEPQIVLENESIQTVGRTYNDEFAFAINDAGEAFFWNNSLTQSPIKLDISVPVKDIDIYKYSGALTQGAALTQDGDVFMWNDLGNPQPKKVDFPKSPAVIKEIHVSGNRGIALSETGDLFAWQIGTDISTYAVEITFNSDPNIKNITSTYHGSSYYSGGVAIADNAVYGWSGPDSSGSFSTQEILSDNSAIRDVIRTYAVNMVATDNALYTWDSSVGSFSTQEILSQPVQYIVDHEYSPLALTDDGEVFKIKKESNSSNYSLIKIEGLPTNIKALSYGTALTSDGDVYVYAWNSGDMTVTKVPFEQSVVSIATGSFSHTIVLLEDGMMCGWGNNDYGQLGNDNPNSVPATNPVCLEDLTVKSSSVKPSSCDDGVATYLTATKELSFDKLAMELYSPLTDEPTDKFALFATKEGASIKLQTYPGFLDFSLPTKIDVDFVETIDDRSCYPTYLAQQETLVFPKVIVPLVGVDWLGIYETDAIDCYTATMEEATTQKVFRLIDAAPIDCEE
ncbi:hypothetical protein [Candidatus Albibeggiatoa sp. nov. BB20]|uniref:hypothetical protein n=1 Tax=Candidatus Albibeggiatoa sp. nov. BB20 TaxID=3162723 RepID=UPI0033658C57